jgi:hypothetical protein
MKAYEIKELKERIAKQERLIKVIERSFDLPSYQKPYDQQELRTRLDKETRVLNRMVATLERGIA